MDNDTYETIRDNKYFTNKKINELIERIEILEDKLNIEKKKVPCEVLNEKIVEYDTSGQECPSHIGQVHTWGKAGKCLSCGEVKKQEEMIDLDENTELDKVIHPVTGPHTPGETSKVIVKKIIARDTQ